jgi:beta-glucanase (GH16 family)
MVSLRLFMAVLMLAARPGALAAQVDETLSLAQSVETLRQDFRAPPVWRGGAVQVQAAPRPLSDPEFSWAAGYIWSHPPVGAPTPWPQPAHDFPAWTSNGAADADPNGDMIARIGAARSPLTWSGTLSLIARRMPPDLAATLDRNEPHDYIGAAITSFPFGQRYGVFAMSARLPTGRGLWPAFWLLPLDKSWPPEIDIMEVIGRQPDMLYTTLHVKGPAALGHGTPTHNDLGAAFHEYAVDWGPTRISWYFDRKLVFTLPTPEELQKPCYILVDLAVGRPGQWGGAPDDTTRFPATMAVASVRVWQRARYLEQRP